MLENASIMVSDEAEGTENSSSSRGRIIGLKFDILDESVNFCIGVTHGQASLADIVPLARTISRKITDIAVEKIQTEGGRIPCCKGCSACCHYLVPLSVPEAFRLREDILSRPASQRRLM